MRGEGAVVWDDTGREYVDGMASLWCVNVGHGRREIIDAVTAQMSALACYHTFEPFANEPSDRLADEIAAVAPMPGARIFLTTSGSEAVDSAIKLARLAHARAGRGERTLIVSRGRGYHGVTFGGMAAQGLPPNQEGFGPHVEGFENLPPDDIEVWASFMAARGDEVAAVLVEPVQGAGGVYPPPDGYLAALRRLCDQHGAYLIFDEVICAFGRLGEWFGARHFDVVPDLVTFAKGVSSGYVPLGGVVVGPDGARAARVRSHLPPPPRSYVLRAPHVRGSRARQHRVDARRRPAGACARHRRAALGGAPRDRGRRSRRRGPRCRRGVGGGPRPLIVTPRRSAIACSTVA